MFMDTKFQNWSFLNNSDFGINIPIVIIQVGVIKHSFVCILHQNLQNDWN